MIRMNLVISKPCCPMYKFGISNKMDLIPRRISNLHLQGPCPSVSITTTRMLKHRPYLLSALKDDGKSAPRSLVSEIIAEMAPFRVYISVGFISWVAQFISGNYCISRIISSGRYYLFLLLLAVDIAGTFLGRSLYGFAVVLNGKPFSVGDIIKVGSMEGRVTGMGLLTTSLLSAENASILVSNSLFGTQFIVNKTHVGWHEMVSKFLVQIDEIEKIHLISEEIINMMNSNSNVYLEERQPYCCLSKFQGYCVELTLGCNLKEMCEDELLLAKQDVLAQSSNIIKKHGATIVEDMGK